MQSQPPPQDRLPARSVAAGAFRTAVAAAPAVHWQVPLRNVLRAGAVVGVDIHTNTAACVCGHLLLGAQQGHRPGECMHALLACLCLALLVKLLRTSLLRVEVSLSLAHLGFVQPRTLVLEVSRRFDPRGGVPAVGSVCHYCRHYPLSRAPLRAAQAEMRESQWWRA